MLHFPTNGLLPERVEAAARRMSVPGGPRVVVTVSVDGLEVLDLEGNHPAGPLGFYAFSQEEATFELVVPDQLSVCREDGTVVGYTGGVCTGCSSSGGGIWAALLALAALRRRR